MAVLGQSALTLLSSTVVDMKTAASTVLYTVPVGRYARIYHIVVRDSTASLAGGTSYGITGWRTGWSLTTMTSFPATYMVVKGAELTAYSEFGPSTTIPFVVTTGSTAVANATIDLFGYITT